MFCVCAKLLSVPVGVSNYAYFQDENHNSSGTYIHLHMNRFIPIIYLLYSIFLGNACKTDTAEVSSKNQIPVAQQPDSNKPASTEHVPNCQTSAAAAEIPKYLEIICDNYEPPFNDGYEVPRSSIRSNKSVKYEDRSRTFSTSSTISNGSATPIINSNNRDSCHKNDVQKNCVSIANVVLQQGKVQANTDKKCAYSNLTTQPLLESLGSVEENDCSVNNVNNLTQTVH